MAIATSACGFGSEADSPTALSRMRRLSSATSCAGRGASSARRGDLAEVFVAALHDRDPPALPQQLEMTREKAQRAPLLLAVARLDEPDREVPAAERWISLGCAIQNLLLATHAMGYGSALTSGQAIAPPRPHPLFALGPGEVPVCIVNFGTVGASRPLRPRPDAAELFGWLWPPTAPLAVPGTVGRSVPYPSGVAGMEQALAAAQF